MQASPAPCPIRSSATSVWRRRRCNSARRVCGAVFALKRTTKLGEEYASPAGLLSATSQAQTLSGADDGESTKMIAFASRDEPAQALLPILAGRNPIPVDGRLEPGRPQSRI